MVDDNESHIGWQLWQAAQSWKAAFTAEMRAAGHGWYGESRGGLFRFIDPANGIAQSALTQAVGLSKQAVQKQVLELEHEGIITRKNTPNDKRAKHIVLTPSGQKALSDARKIKHMLQSRYATKIGSSNLQTLSSLLETLSK